jgi:hypothetical protein
MCLAETCCVWGVWVAAGWLTPSLLVLLDGSGFLN